MSSDEQLRGQFLEILTHDSVSHVLRVTAVVASLVVLMVLGTLYFHSVAAPTRILREYSEPMDVEADNFFQYSSRR